MAADVMIMEVYMEFKIDKLKCGGCVASLESALKQLDGSIQINVDLSTKHATILSTQSVEALLGAMAAAGFPGVLLGEGER